jgi:steroid 5-alpha reductase family enzyme
MPVLTALLIAALALVLLFALVWAVQLRTRNAGLVDAVWAWSLGLLAVFFALAGNAPGSLRVTVAMLGGLWGLRLGTHLYLRNRGRPEDGRYARFREEWGEHADRNMFWFFQLQVVFSLLLAVAFVIPAYAASAPPVPCVLASVVVWLASVGGEALADLQLERFRRDPSNRGRVCRNGLWRYSRHPNYFFECMHWLAYPLLAAGSGLWWLTLAPPAIMAYLLMRLSGIPLTEAQTARSRPDYAEYMRTTSPLIPWPPRKPRD